MGELTVVLVEVALALGAGVLGAMLFEFLSGGRR